MLHEWVRELEARLGQTSANSSRPPSSDPPQAVAKRRPPPTGRKRGGQPGHRGACRALLPIEEVHERSIVPTARTAASTLPGGRGGGHVFELLDSLAIVAQMRQTAAATPLRPMPLAVLAHGLPFAAPFPDWPGEAMEEIMLDRERNLSTLVPNARFSIARQSGHNIHQDQPALVSEAIRQVVAGVRDRDTWYELAACCRP